MKYDSVAIYAIKGELGKTGLIDRVWNDATLRDKNMVFLQNLPAKKMAPLFSIVSDYRIYKDHTLWTPHLSAAVVFFYKGNKTGYMSFDFRQSGSDAVQYSHYVTPFEKGSRDVNFQQKEDRLYFPGLTREGMEKIRSFFLKAGWDTKTMGGLKKNHIDVR